jgi:hypothetical protein
MPSNVAGEIAERGFERAPAPEEDFLPMVEVGLATRAVNIGPLMSFS